MGNKTRRNASIIDNIKILYNAREKAFKLFNDYAELMTDPKRCLHQGKGIKIL